MDSASWTCVDAGGATCSAGPNVGDINDVIKDSIAIVNHHRVMRAGIEWEVPEPDNPWANIGYWNDQDKTDAAFIIPPGKEDRFYRTGDLAQFSQEGHLFHYLGRSH